MILLLLIAQLNSFDGAFTPRFELPSHDQKYAEWFSDATVAGALAKDTYDSWRAPNRLAAFRCQGIRDIAILGATTLIKHYAKRERPNGSDQNSFPSEHSAFAASVQPGYFMVGITLATAGGRIAAGQHYASDTVIGAGIGMGARFLTRNCR